MTEEELDAIRQREAAATSGPFSVCIHGNNAGFDVVSAAKNKLEILCIVNRRADAEFIAHAYEDVSTLCAEIKRLRAENSDLGDLWQNSERAYQNLITNYEEAAPKIDDEIQQAELFALRAENERLREALRFYGTESNYQPQTDAYGHRQRPIMVYKWTKVPYNLRTLIVTTDSNEVQHD